MIIYNVHLNVFESAVDVLMMQSSSNYEWGRQRVYGKMYGWDVLLITKYVALHRWEQKTLTLRPTSSEWGWFSICINDRLQRLFNTVSEQLSICPLVDEWHRFRSNLIPAKQTLSIRGDEVPADLQLSFLATCHVAYFPSFTTCWNTRSGKT